MNEKTPPSDIHQPAHADLFVSCVGEQPSALAVAIKSWAPRIETGPLTVLLLATPQTWDYAQRLRAWMRRTIKVENAPVDDVEIRLVSPGLVDTDSPSPGRALTEYLSKRSAPRHVFCGGDPGLKAMVLSLIDALNTRGMPYTRIHADVDDLHFFKVTDRLVSAERTLKLRNLRVDDLFSLYGLDLKTSPLDEHSAARLGEHFLKAFKSAGPDTTAVVCAVPSSAVSWIVAREKRGRLYLLVSPSQISNKKHTLSAREVMHLRGAFGKLRPELTVLAYDTVKQHLENVGVDSINPEKSSHISKWLRRSLRSPGSVVPPGSPVPTLPDDFGEPMEPVPDGLLIQVFGWDPSSNLISLATHAADGFDKVLFIVDPTVPELLQRARYVLENIRAIGYTQARLLRSDFLESQANTQIVRWMSHITPGLTQRVRFDVTPGTKAQTADLMALMSDRRCLWMLQGADGTARSLDGTQTRPLRGPDIRIWANAIGGPLVENSGKRVEADRFSAALAAVLRDAPATASHSLGEWLNEIASNESRLRRTKDDHYEVLADDGIGGAVWLRAESKDTGTIYERLAAECVRHMPHDELRSGLEWSWDPDMSARRNIAPGSDGSERCELDLVMRRAHRVVCISCKSYVQGENRFKQSLVEIESVAREGFSRFTIPVLIGFGIDAQRKQNAIDATGGAILLDQEELLSASHLREALDRGIWRRIPQF